MLIQHTSRLADARLNYANAAMHIGCCFLLAEQPDSAIEHFHAALDHDLPGGIEPHLPLLTEEAERCAARGDHREAIQRWQDIATLLGAATPPSIYHQLSAAYAANQSGFGGTDVENMIWGGLLQAHLPRVAAPLVAASSVSGDRS
jgi:tetratricopeptide (TPR) repeat protein